MGREQPVVFKLSRKAKEGEGTKKQTKTNTKATITTAITTRTTKNYAPERHRHL